MVFPCELQFTETAEVKLSLATSIARMAYLQAYREHGTIDGIEVLRQQKEKGTGYVYQVRASAKFRPGQINLVAFTSKFSTKPVADGSAPTVVEVLGDRISLWPMPHSVVIPVSTVVAGGRAPAAQLKTHTELVPYWLIGSSSDEKKINMQSAESQKVVVKVGAMSVPVTIPTFRNITAVKEGTELLKLKTELANFAAKRAGDPLASAPKRAAADGNGGKGDKGRKGGKSGRGGKSGKGGKGKGTRK